MAYPGHPKSAEVDAMLLDFKSIKEIAAALGVTRNMVHHRAENTKLRRVYLTPTEYAALAAQRKAKR